MDCPLPFQGHFNAAHSCRQTVAQGAAAGHDTLIAKQKLLPPCSMDLNQTAHDLAEELINEAARFKINLTLAECGTSIVDCGIHVPGSVEAGVILAKICMAGRAQIDVVQSKPDLWHGPSISVHTDDPVTACMASQYAGWKIEGSKFFAMGSGPMRAAGSREPLFDTIGRREKPSVAVGVLETRKIPPDPVCVDIANACGVSSSRLTLLVAPTASIAGGVQIVARSVETALHKLHELGFDLERITQGHGVAPLPPVAGDDLTAIGLTNDAILYGGEVTLWVRGSDSDLETIGARVPSSASPAHGEPFIKIFKRHNGDFYAIDPMLFSPAVVTFKNIETGHEFRFGRLEPAVITESFKLS